MTDNQQRIIDSLVAEFNTRNETKERSSFKLINVDEFDEINNLHKELLKDSEKNKELWEEQRVDYITELIDQLKDDLGGRLIVSRGDVATENSNYATSIFIYKTGTEKWMMTERAFRFDVILCKQIKQNATTKEYYDEYLGLQISSHQMTYKNEEDLFKCEYTKIALKNLLNQ
jgi:superfamily I DNA and RNA helicase